MSAPARDSRWCSLTGFIVAPLLLLAAKAVLRDRGHDGGEWLGYSEGHGEEHHPRLGPHATRQRVARCGVVRRGPVLRTEGTRRSLTRVNLDMLAKPVGLVAGK